jgi:hypothetical protein
VKAEDIRPEIYRCYPDSDNYGWNVKFFGPLRILIALQTDFFKPYSDFYADGSALKKSEEYIK